MAEVAFPLAVAGHPVEERRGRRPGSVAPGLGMAVLLLYSVVVVAPVL
jgi:hypothetical protein